MKTKKIQYHIDEPCHADWDTMKPEAQGRFCSECSKVVVDFSEMSDFSIVNYLENNRHQSVCGRFAEDQLDKTYVWTKPHVSPFHFDLKAVALGLALSTFSALPSQAQEKPAIELDSTIKIVVQGNITTAYSHGSAKAVSGTVQISGKSSKLSQITLFDGNSKELLSVTSDRDGKFQIPLDWSQNPAGIQITSPGCYTRTIYFSRLQSFENLVVTLSKRSARGTVKGKLRY